MRKILKKRLNKKIIFLLIFFLSFAIFGLAQEVKYPSVPGAPSISPTTNFPQYAKYLFNFFIIVGGIIALGALIYAAILWITSAGNPAQIERAKNKALASLLGLIILVSCYFIVVTINPRLSLFRLEKIASRMGIYLITSDKKVFVFSESTSSTLVSSASNIILKFTLPPEELRKVYLFNQEGYKGSYDEIDNPGINSTTTTSFTTIKSVCLVKSSPGAYLYGNNNYQISPGENFGCPFYVYSQANSLNEYNNKTNSIEIRGATGTTEIGGFLFIEEGLKGKCGYFRCSPGQKGVSNLDSSGSGCDYQKGGMANDKLKSLLLFRRETTTRYTGEVIFYQGIGCKGTSTTTTAPDGWKTGSLSSNTKSFKITGPFRVLLEATNGDCQGDWTDFLNFTTRCVEMLKGTKVYSATDPTIRPTKFYIFPIE